MDLFPTLCKKVGDTHVIGSTRPSYHESLFYLHSETDPVHKNHVLNLFAFLELPMMDRVQKTEQN
jgi:hypothetical protein